MAREPDHYGVFDLPRTATAAEIKRRYRKLMREVHPDANVDDPEATRKAARINAAFETLGNAERRAEYDARTNGKRGDRRYAEWAEQPDWEDIVAENVPPRRPPHVHDEPPVIEPEEIEVSMDELEAGPRVRRRLSVTNRCHCTLKGDVSTSEPWVWGPIGRFVVGPGQTVEFDIQIVARKVTFPGISRVLFVTDTWTGVVPVRITGYEAKARRKTPSANMAYVPYRQRRRARPR